MAIMTKNKNGMFEYKGKEIFPFHSDRFVPNHIIKEYYQGEQDSIDRAIRLEAIPINSNSKTIDEDLEDFFNEICL